MTETQYYPYFWVGGMQDPNIFGCKIFRESMFLGLNFTLHTHTPIYKYMKYPLPPGHESDSCKIATEEMISESWIQDDECTK